MLKYIFLCTFTGENFLSQSSDDLWTLIHRITKRGGRGREKSFQVSFNSSISSPNLSKSCDDKLLHDSVPETREETRGAEVWMRLEACSDASSRGPPLPPLVVSTPLTKLHATPTLSILLLLSLLSNSFRTINIFASHNPFDRSPLNEDRWMTLSTVGTHVVRVYIKESFISVSKDIPL